jgi:deoxyadenosine/deoxycytidine kinase
LFQRINEVRDQAQMDLFNTRTVSDYLFEKDALFARLNLSEDEFKLYQNIYQSLAPQAPTPDLVIYLQASTDTLSERVRRRGRNYERSVSDDYLSRLGDSYGEFFHHYEGAPLMMVNSENLNFVDNDVDFNLLLERIEGMRGPREFFSLGI